MNNKFITNLFVYFVFALAFVERTFFDLGPNVELVTLGMLLASIHLSRNTALKLVFILMAVTDLVIGNTRIFLFTWTGFLLPILIISRLELRNSRLEIMKTTSWGMLANLFFYLWSNFGVWLLDSWGMYSRDFTGLLHSYYMGLPFLKLQLLSTLIFVPLGFFLYYKIEHWTLNFEPSKQYNA